MPDVNHLELELRNYSKAQMESHAIKHQLRVDRLRRRLRLAKAPTPLHFLAIGDSWFNYPLDDSGWPIAWNPAIVGDHQLQAMGSPHPVILSRAVWGQAMTAIMSWENQEQIIGDLTNKQQWLNQATGLPDGILVSGGGDDMAGDQFAIYLNYGGGGLNNDRFQGVLDSVKASYMKLFQLRDEFAPKVPIFSHCYDYAVPSDRHPIFVRRSWLKPSLDFALYTESEACQAVIDAIDGFYSLLKDLEKDSKNLFTVVDTRKTLTPDTLQPLGWANEIHPYSAGYTALAKDFLGALRGAFPGKI